MNPEQPPQAPSSSQASGMPGAAARERLHVFAGNPLDRADAQRRDTDWLAAASVHADARFLPLHKLRVALTAESDPALCWLSPAELARHPSPDAPPILLGIASGAPRFAVDFSHVANLPGGAEYHDCRKVAAMLAPGDVGIVAHARAQLDWHRRNRFCGNCGAPTAMDRGGQVRRCAACESHIFPRTDPVVIMLITHNDRCLLGRSALAPPNRKFYSALAGFVDQAESIEEAVRREVREEAGIEVGAVSYHSSQPWPFPASLMIGCHGEALTSDITIDPREMADVRWFERAELHEAFAERLDYRLPGDIAIAHHLITHWLHERD